MCLVYDTLIHKRFSLKQIIVFSLLSFSLIFFPVILRAASVCQAIPAQRIISLSPNLTEILDALGASDKLVAVDKMSDYPARVKQLPHLNGLRGKDLEIILSLKPDLIVVWEQSLEVNTQAFLEKQGVQIYHAYFPDLESISAVTKDLGCLTGHTVKADEKAAQFMENLTTLSKAYEKNSEKTVFFQLWPKPLFALGGVGFLSDALKRCGGKNIFEGVGKAGFRANTEMVLKAQPDFILSFDEGMQGLEQWKQWKQLKAVKFNHLVYIKNTLLARPSLRILPGVRELCEVLH
jgi:iron complex transport system substrate-binding protein